MTNTLLGDIAKLGFKHDEALAILTQYKESEGKEKEEEEEKDDSVKVKKPEGKPKDEVKADKPAATDNKKENAEPDIKKKGEAIVPDVSKMVKEEVVKQLKIKRKDPSAGEIRETSTVQYGISNRGYEELV